MRCVVLVALLVGLAAADLNAKYPFSSVLYNSGDQYYGLHWNFSLETQMMYFAVNVSTNGWVGFGLSPNGGMTGSDVVIGWVDGSGTYFHDRFAKGQFLPPIDSKTQDWCLSNGEEKGKFTVLEFSRNFSTCDTEDLEITADTARVVWSYNSMDPKNINGTDARRHDKRGSASLNLIGGNPVSRPLQDNELFLDITVSDVVIPNDTTTYWCQSYQLPSDVVNTTHFVNRISPAITSHTSEYVHHILVYLCPTNLPLMAAEVDRSDKCDNLGGNIGSCRSTGVLVGGWAVGGDDFVYPEEITFPVGGIGQEHFVVMEMHYDNPRQVSGVIDNSGLRFYYTTEEPEQRAGVMYLGHEVPGSILVPPQSKNFTIASICSMECTNSHIPEEGITIIGNLLHTHLAGRSVTISHYRRNTTTNQLIELPPLDQNLNYDFNFQQFVHLRKPRKVLPGDILVMKCIYNTIGRSTITFGGLATEDEMCLSFPVFYPRLSDGTTLVRCSSTPDTSVAFNEFGYYAVMNRGVNETALRTDFVGTLNGLDWQADPKLATSLQDSVLNSAVYSICARENGMYAALPARFPVPDVPYVAPDMCEGQPKTFCLASTDGAPPLVKASLLLVGLVVMLLSMLIR